MSEQPRRQENQTIWFSRIKDWRKSGLSQAEYCRQHDLKPSNFYNWSIKYRDHQASVTDLPGGRKTATPTFIPVTFQSASSEFRLSCNDVSLHFPSGLTPESLVPWIKALRDGAC